MHEYLSIDMLASMTPVYKVREIIRGGRNPDSPQPRKCPELTVEIRRDLSESLLTYTTAPVQRIVNESVRLIKVLKKVFIRMIV